MPPFCSGTSHARFGRIGRSSSLALQGAKQLAASSSLRGTRSICAWLVGPHPLVCEPTLRAKAFGFLPKNARASGSLGESAGRNFSLLMECISGRGYEGLPVIQCLLLSVQAGPTQAKHLRRGFGDSRVHIAV